jgi:hypothetical protein
MARLPGHCEERFVVLRKNCEPIWVYRTSSILLSNKFDIIFLAQPSMTVLSIIC